MSSIRDYPDAQRILAKHGRKRLALGSKVASGPRDETTSGTQSDSEIELKITRPDSDGTSQSTIENRIIENNNNVCASTNNCTTRKLVHTNVDIDIKDDNVFEDTSSITATSIKEPSPRKFLVSPRNSVFLDKPQNNSLPTQLKRTSSGFQGNVVGPATSLKSLDKRSLEKSLSQSFSQRMSPRLCRGSGHSTSADEGRDSIHNHQVDDTTTKRTSKRWLKPRSSSCRRHMKRSNSDMQRATRRKSHHHRERDVFSDGENNEYHRRQDNNNKNNSTNNNNNKSPSINSQCSNNTANSISYRNNYPHNHFTNNKLPLRNEDSRESTTSDEDIFLRAMTKLYLESTKHFKKRTVRISYTISNLDCF